MGINFGIMPPIECSNKKERHGLMVKRAKDDLIRALTSAL